MFVKGGSLSEVRAWLIQVTVPELFKWASRSTEGIAEQQRPLLAQIIHWQIQLWQRAALWHQGRHQMRTALTCHLIVKDATNWNKLKWTHIKRQIYHKFRWVAGGLAKGHNCPKFHHLDTHLLEDLQFRERVLQGSAQSLHTTGTNSVLCQVHFSQVWKARTQSCW